jgi:MYXO-CTERM domain-containing protein
MYHDADNSGTISDGDRIHVTDSMKIWYDVRLYSVSADAYSDDNPMHDAPGFTGLVGMLALLGAAFIRRND